MKHLVVLILILSTHVFFAETAIGQDNQRQITQSALMYAPDAAEYISMEQEIWKPVHAQRIRDGEISGWYLYQAVTPGAYKGHNFMTVEIYPDWSNVEMAYTDIDKLIEEVHGVNAMEWAGPRTDKARKMVTSIWWTPVAGTRVDDFSFDNVNYVQIDWMSVHAGHMDDYLEMERNVFMPVHQQRVDGGNILSWALYQNLNYSEAPGNVGAVTSASFENFDAIWDSYPEDAWESAHPGVDPDEMLAKILEHRTMSGMTIYRLVDKVEAAN